MNTVWTSRNIVDGKKVLVLDSDCQFNIDAIKESIQVINNLKADYGLLTLWGIELRISSEDIAEEVFENFKLTMKKLRGEDTMDKEWTFTEYGNEEWVYETFKNKDDAITEGRIKFPNEPIMVGQLKDSGNSYRIENKEIIKLDGGIVKC